MQSLQSRSRFFLALLLLLLAGAPAFLWAASGSDDDPDASWSGSYRGRVLDERFLHQQAVARGLRQRASVQALEIEAPPRALRSDAGNIAIIESTGGVVIEPNVFDLNGQNVMFLRGGAGYTATSGPSSFSELARTNGSTVTLLDDDAKEVFLPFAFPFFAGTHLSVFVHSDGNVTFDEPEAGSGNRTLSRAVTGPPRIAALFNDLNPSDAGAAVRTYGTPEAFYVTWDGVPEFSLFGGTNRQTFQLVLRRGGNIEFHYRAVGVASAVVGIMPGRLLGEPKAADLSLGVSQPASAALAEIFSSSRDLDTIAAGQRFYQNHDDSYDMLVLFNDISLSPGGGAFAFEVGVRNQVLGIGDVLLAQPVFDFGEDYGSARRLQGFMNMGPLVNYPADPEVRIPIVGENNTLSVLTHEAGHRFLAYVTFLDPLLSVPSTRLLGRQLAHWSFLFNSKASVMEGNEITDQGLVSPRFRTTAAVNHFSDFDQYLMGLRGPEEVVSSFLVENARNFSPSPRSGASAPQIGVSFDGSRTEVPLDLIIAAEGARVPEARVSQKDFRFAFILLVAEGAQPSATTLAKLETFRARWEDYFEAAADHRANSETELVRMLQLSTWPAGGIVRGLPGRAAVEIAAAQPTNLDVLLTADSGAITAPSVVTIPAGQRSVSFPLIGNNGGTTRLTAHTNVAGFDTAVAIVEVRESANLLALEVLSGDDQIGGRGAALPKPVVFQIHDQNLLPYSGVPIVLAASGNGSIVPERGVTDALGRLEASWTLASSASLNTLTATIEGVPGGQVTLQALSVGPPAFFSAAGVVNAASFALGAAAPHRALAPGGLISIFGQGLALETARAESLPLPLTLGGVRARFGGIPAPLLYVSPTQINLQVPFEVSGASTEIVVETPAGNSAPVAAQIASTQPGIFFDFATGLGAIVSVNDNTPVWTRPARAGTAVAIFCTGLGAVDPAGLTGAAAQASPASQTLLAVIVAVAGRNLAASFAGLAPGFAGLYQVNVTLPSDLPPGRHMLSVTIGGRQSNEVPIDVQ